MLLPAPERLESPEQKAGPSPEVLAQITAPVADGLREVELRLQDLVPESLGGPAPGVYRHMLQAGGKRLRPALALLSCAAAGGDSAAAVDAGVAVEVLHLSSLIHDDVIDEAEQRRGQPSVRHLWGNKTAVLVGDFLVAQVFRWLAENLAQQSLTILAQAVTEMCQAELNFATGGEITEEQYRANIQGKTGALVAAACEIGALQAQRPELAPILHRYGQKLGEGFQITDDLLDLYAPEAVTGKPELQDLRKGHWSLPVLHALRTAPAAEAERLRALLAQAPQDAAAARAAADLTAALGGRAHAEAAAAEVLAEAREALQTLAPTPSVASLQALVDWVASRRN